MVRRYRFRRVCHAAGRLLYWAIMLAVIALAPIIVIAGEPLRRYCFRRFGRTPLVRSIVESTAVKALTAPGRWTIGRLSRGVGHIRRRRGPGDWPPPSDMREPRRPRPTAPAGAIALAEPRLQHRIFPIRKSFLSQLSEAVRRTGRRLRQTAGLAGRLVNHQLRRTA